MKSILKFLLLSILCFGSTNFAFSEDKITPEQIIGAWELVSMSKEPQDEITPTDILYGYSEYHEDGTYFSYHKWRDFPDKEPFIVKGRYVLSEQKITHFTSDGKSIIGSGFIELKDNYLILNPKTENGFITYSKRTEKKKIRLTR